jgi:hypothetical protein
MLSPFKTMDELESLVRQHKFRLSRYRTNLGGEVQEYAKSRFLKAGIYSNSVREGPVLECVQEMLGEQINELCLNRSVPMGPHRDSKNSAEVSFVCFLGDYTGGALCIQEDTDLRKLTERRVWHTFSGQKHLHWVEPFEGERYSVVAYTRKHRARAPRRACKACNPAQLHHSAAQPPIH